MSDADLWHINLVTLLYKNIYPKEYRAYIVSDFSIPDFDFNCDHITSCPAYWNIVYVDHSEHVHMIANTNFIIEIPLNFFNNDFKGFSLI